MTLHSQSQSRFHAAADGRDFSIYTKSMSAATEAKAQQLFPHLRIPENGKILDVGSGTGDLAKLAAEQFSRADVYGLDLSHELLEIADEGRTLFKLVYGDARNQNFPSNYFDGAYCCTMGHEVVSFGSLDDLNLMLTSLNAQIKPGSQYIHRDFANPELSEEVYLKLTTTDGEIDSVPNEMPPDEIDYTKLTTRALFIQFAQQFQGGGAVRYSFESVDDVEYIKLDAKMAYEFISRKDYRANFLNEIKETYGYWTPGEGVHALKSAGFTDVVALPEYNEWILNNRWKDKIALYLKDSDGKLEELPFFPTHVTWIATKPGEHPEEDVQVAYPEVDYTALLQTISHNTDRTQIHIDDLSFRIAPEVLRKGSKREVYQLTDRPRAMLKVPRRDGLNTHNCFKAMYQGINRTDVLTEYEVPHAKLLEYDESGPPYRYLIQEQLQEGAPSAAQLIEQGLLHEIDVQQMARIVNRFEKKKEWQLDTNPYNWFRLTQPDGTTQMTYADGKVYRYDEEWTFSRVGLLQWVLPELLATHNGIECAHVPTEKLALQTEIWWDQSNPVVSWWQKHLDPSLHP